MEAAATTTGLRRGKGRRDDMTDNWLYCAVPCWAIKLLQCYDILSYYTVHRVVWAGCPNRPLQCEHPREGLLSVCPMGGWVGAFACRYSYTRQVVMLPPCEQLH